MAWPIVLHQEKPNHPTAGDAWPVGGSHEIMLPSGVAFPLDHPLGWTVSGEMPNVTVHPSINHEGGYHGWIRDGVLSNDVDGRTFG